jgi:hypothetical protein
MRVTKGNAERVWIVAGTGGFATVCGDQGAQAPSPVVDGAPPSTLSERRSRTSSGGVERGAGERECGCAGLFLSSPRGRGERHAGARVLPVSAALRFFPERRAA